MGGGTGVVIGSDNGQAGDLLVDRGAHSASKDGRQPLPPGSQDARATHESPNPRNRE